MSGSGRARSGASYTTTLCAFGDEVTNVGLVYWVFGDLTMKVGEATLTGIVTGQSNLLADNTLDHHLLVEITGGTRRFTGATGHLEITGTVTYDYTHGITITDEPKFTGTVTYPRS